jgi:hypothetical protein
VDLGQQAVQPVGDPGGLDGRVVVEPEDRLQLGDPSHRQSGQVGDRARRGPIEVGWSDHDEHRIDLLPGRVTVVAPVDPGDPLSGYKEGGMNARVYDGIGIETRIRYDSSRTPPFTVMTSMPYKPRLR